MQKEHPLPDHPFWRFITTIRAQETIRGALSQAELYPAIQINLLLFCCWFAQAGRGRLTKQDLLQLIAATTPWHERILKPLQDLPQHGAGLLPSHLQQNIAAEIELAEHIEQLLLADVPIKFARAARNPSQKLGDACRNIALYCRMQQVPVNVSLNEAFYILLAGVFPKIDLLETQRTCQNLLPEDSFALQGKLLLN